MSLYILPSEVEHRVILKLFYKLGTSRDAAVTEITQSYVGVNVISLLEWWKRFEKGEDDVYDEDAALTREVYTFIRDNPLVSIETIIAKFRISQLAIEKALRKLSLKVYIGRIVPFSPTNIEKRERLNFCNDMLTMINNNISFTQELIIGLQIWLFKYVDVDYQDTSQDQSRTLKVNTQSMYLPVLEGKKMSVSFFDTNQVISHEILPEDKIGTGDYYLYFIKHIVRKLRKNPKYRQRPWYLLVENRPPQNSIAVRQFLARNEIVVIYYPLNALDIVPLQYEMYWKLREVALYKDKTAEDIMNTTMAKFKKEENYMLRNFFLQWHKNLCTCISQNGDYLSVETLNDDRNAF